MGRTLSLVFSYLWAIGTSLVFPLTFWYALERVTDRTEVLIVSFAGILYAAMVELLNYQHLGFYRLSKQLAERTVAIQRVVDPGLISESDYRQALILRDSVDLHTNMKILLMSLIALAVFFYCLIRLSSVL
jgi:hypothetical protein